MSSGRGAPESTESEHTARTIPPQMDRSMRKPRASVSLRTAPSSYRAVIYFS